MATEATRATTMSGARAETPHLLTTCGEWRGRSRHGGRPARPLGLRGKTVRL